MTRDYGSGNPKRMARASAPLVASGGDGRSPEPFQREALQRRTATTVVRRIGHVANTALGALVSESRSQGYAALAQELEDDLAGIVEALLTADFTATDVEGA